MVSNLKGFRSAQSLYNLIGYFGDVVKILLLKNKQNAMVEFSSHAEALMCVQLFNKKRIFNSKISVAFSHSHQYISYK